MSAQVLPFVPPKGHERSVTTIPIVREMPRFGVGDGLSISVGKASEEGKSMFRRVLVNEYPALKNSPLLLAGRSIEVWRDDLLVGICEVSGNIDDDDGTGFKDPAMVTGAMKFEVVYALPTEKKKLVSEKIVTMVYCLIRSSLQKIGYADEHAPKSLCLGFEIKNKDRHSTSLAETLLETTDEFACELRRNGENECFLWVDRG